MDRDTQFAGFTKALLKEMLEQTQWEGMDFNSDDTEEVEKYSLIIARRAYDLVDHAVKYGCKHGIIFCPIEQIPDLTEFPEVK